MSVLSRRLVLIVSIVLLAIVATLYALPALVRHVAIARIGAITNRSVRIDRVDLAILTGHLTVRGFRLAERNGETPFADFEQLDVRLRLLPLLRGRLSIQEAVLRNSTVRVVRFPTGFNLDDLMQSSGTTSGPIDVTVDRFAVVGGTVTLEDRALPEWRTWTSENIQIEARDISTRRDDGRVSGTSVTAGAPTSIEIEHLRLYPVHLQATMTVKGLDLALARLYLPPDAPVHLDRGRASSSMRVVLDGRTGLRAEGKAQLEDIALVRPGEREPEVRVPAMTTELTDFVFQDGRLQIGRFEVVGSASVRDPSATGAARFKVSTVRASIADLTWPITTPGRLDLQTTVPGGGNLALTGALRPPPASSQLQLLLTDLDLAPWARFLPGSARITGVAEANLRINEPLRAGVPTRVQGSIAVNRLGVKDAREEILVAQRVEATGLQVHWPTRLAVEQLIVSGPRATVERDKAGDFPALRLWSRPVPAATGAVEGSRAAPSTPPSGALEIGAIAVRDGSMTWRDQTTAPPVLFGVARIEARLTGIGWPVRGPAGVTVAARPPGGGQIEVAGRVGVDPFMADLRLRAKDADLAPYQAYVPAAAQVGGWADLDLAVRLSPESRGRATVRGDAALSRVNVRDGQRTVISAGRAAVTGLDVEWPERVTVRRLGLQQPWILFERDKAGALALLGLAPTPAAGPSAPAERADRSTPSVAVTLREIAVDDGGARVVDRSVSPPFAVDLSRLALQGEEISTAPGKTGRVRLTARLGTGSSLEMRGTIGPIGGPLRLDVSGDLRGFWVPRTNPYLAHYVGWEAPEGWLTTSLSCRIDRDALDAKTEIRVSRLQLARGARDEAQARIGLPLGMLVALMKDSRGDIHVSLPVSGRLSDPRFDFSEAIWSTVRNVAVKAITAPVSWIGRVQVSPDSRIERIQVDPIRFQPGTAKPTPDGQEQLSRLTAFLQQGPELRMALTAMISPRDHAELGRQTLGAAIDRTSQQARITPDAAAARLFQERFPGRPLPDDPDAIRTALAGSEPIPPDVTSGLAAQRVEKVRSLLKQAGIDPARLPQKSPLIEAQEGVERESQVALDLVGPESQPQPPPQRREFLGVPLPGAGPKRE